MKKNYFTHYLGMHKWLFGGSVLLAILGAASALVPYVIASRMIAKLIGGAREWSVFGPLMLALAIFVTAASLCAKLSTSISHIATFDLLAAIRRDITAKLRKLPLGVVEAYTSGRLKDIMVEKPDKMEGPYAHVVPEVGGNVMAFLLALIYLFTLDWRLALISLAMFPITLAAYFWNMRNYKARFSHYIHTNAVLNSTIVEYIQGIEVIKAFNQSSREYGRLSKAVHDAAHSATDWMRENLNGMAFMFIFLPSTILLVLPIGSLFYMDGSLPLDRFLTILLVNFGLVTPLMIAMSYMDSIATMNTIFKEITDLLDLPELERPDPSQAVPEGEDITFEHVTFAYKEDPVLKDVSLCFKEGSVNALVGPSGSGKSTITKLIAGFYDVPEGKGRITLGGADVKKLSLPDLNRHIAYVSQRDFLFNRSIRENLAMGRPGITDAEIIDVCRRSGVHDFIMGLENGYDTIVGSGGAALSGGEKQRIAIARAMIKDAPIIILDEATAYTDPENEQVLQASISALIQGKTLIVVAHRLSTVTNSDRIFLINEGRLEAAGTHSELLEASPLYRHMFETHMAWRDAETADAGALAAGSGEVAHV